MGTNHNVKPFSVLSDRYTIYTQKWRTSSSWNAYIYKNWRSHLSARKITDYKNFMFYISAFKSDTRAASRHSKKQDAAVMYRPLLTRALLMDITQVTSPVCKNYSKQGTVPYFTLLITLFRVLWFRTAHSVKWMSKGRTSGRHTPRSVAHRSSVEPVAGRISQMVLQHEFVTYRSPPITAKVQNCKEFSNTRVTFFFFFLKKLPPWNWFSLEKPSVA